MGYIASVSEILQLVETTGNSQLTLDDGIHSNNGMFNEKDNEDSLNHQPMNVKPLDYTTGLSMFAPSVRKLQ